MKYLLSLLLLPTLFPAGAEVVLRLHTAGSEAPVTVSVSDDIRLLVSSDALSLLGDGLSLSFPIEEVCGFDYREADTEPETPVSVSEIAARPMLRVSPGMLEINHPGRHTLTLAIADGSLLRRDFEDTLSVGTGDWCKGVAAVSVDGMHTFKILVK